MKRKTIAVLTSGGDAPGMNAAIRAVVRHGIGSGFKVLGIKGGYNGLIKSDVVEMNLRSVADTIQRVGTFLYTARSPIFRTPEGLAIAKENCLNLGIDGVVVIGGDGSFKGAHALSQIGIPCIGIPGTIDNDIACTDYTIGFDTAMNTCMGMVDKLRDTAQSHHRCSVVEVMGRRSGEIAINTGIAVGATAIIIPEVPFDFENNILKRINKTKDHGKKHFIIVVAEGVGKIEEIAEKIYIKTGIEVRSTVLGHVQRGGSPTVRDRVIASEMGHKAIDLFVNNKINRVVALKCEKVVDYDIKEALNAKPTFNKNLYDIALDISI